MREIKLIDVTAENWEDVCCLHPGEEGRNYVASNSFSIAQSVFEKEWVIKAITADSVLVGFTMYGYSEELDGYEICRFMIGRHFQGKGYGKAALKTIIDEMLERYKCDRLYITTAPENARGKHVYMSVGFVPTGEVCGEGDDAEDVLMLTCDKTHE